MKDYREIELAKLIGSEVVGVAKAGADFGEGFVGLVLERPNGSQVGILFLSDEEGNRAGAYELNELRPARVRKSAKTNPRRHWNGTLKSSKNLRGGRK